MTSFEELIEAFSRESGIGVQIENGDTISLEADGMMVSARYDRDNGMLTIFAPVTDPYSSEELGITVLRTALKLSFNGSGTYGNYLGLVENALILSKSYPLNELDAESFARHLLDLQEAAVAVRDRIRNYSQDAGNNSHDPATIKQMGLGISV